MLFVSGTTVGGSGRSQRELAARLVEFGHEVVFVVNHARGPRRTMWVYEQLADLSARIGGRPGGKLVRWFEKMPGRTVTAEWIDGLNHLTTPIPENAVRQTIETFRPDVVVGNSVLRLTWRKVRSMCDAHGVPTILYIREEEALNHFDNGAHPADAVVANAESLTAAIERLGVTCEFVPSVIELGVTVTESTRHTALVINPIESRGIETVWKIAEQMPDIAFVAQESWPLSAEQLASVEAHLANLPNVEFRRAEPPGPRLYRDARVLLVPYRIDNRPRVIAEAQANGIPVIAADVPALIEAIGKGGSQVGLDDINAWCAELRRLWSDNALYQEMADDALAHSKRPAIEAAAVAHQFESIAQRLVDAHR
ncbi:unannotated protein [freshwater metagenome]|uniref:Unannotated protein n=1 Tax=freshwater metagenome TaxID=449393 RepID=A0A6J7D1G7_9ZZZZ